MMLRQILMSLAVLAGFTWSLAASAQSIEDPSTDVPSERSATVATLPTDRSLRVESGLPLPPTALPDPTLVQPNASWGTDAIQGGGPPLDFKSLLKPRLDLSAEWQPPSGDVSLESYDASAQMPIYPIFGPPPPFITGGYSFTSIDAPVGLDLPQSLHEFSLGMAWMRKINDVWMARLTLTGVFASDFENTSSDAWRIRGGGFALYRPNERWSFAFGALATGRDDIPVVPALGAIWEPSRAVRVNLMLPTPRISHLLVESPTRQYWLYAGAGISGGTWAYERADGVDDRLSYREWRLVLGWESMPPRPPGSFFSTGTVWNAEVGYVLGREFEFDRNYSDISLDNALLLRTRVKF